MIYQFNELPPEYKKAVSFLEKCLDESTITLPIRAEITEKILQEGSFLFTSKKFRTRDIPSGEFWKWNQSKGRFTVKLNNSEVVFYKLIPRSTNKMHKTPKLKIWCFKVTFPNGKAVRLLWCERGYTKEPTLEELEFLRDFMPQHLANEIWPSSPSQNFDTFQANDYSEKHSGCFQENIDTELSQLLFSSEFDQDLSWLHQL